MPGFVSAFPPQFLTMTMTSIMTVPTSAATMATSARPALRYGALRMALVLLAASAMPTARAECFIDQFGNEQCRLSNGARVGIAVAIIVAFIVLIIAIGLTRRRRIMRANQAFIVAQQQQSAVPYGNQYSYGGVPHDPTNSATQYPQYPPIVQGYYNHQGGYASSQGLPPGSQQPPPQYNSYQPPRSPPPAKV